MERLSAVELGPGLSSDAEDPTSTPIETCDGKDNDCDRRVEGVREGDRYDYIGKARTWRRRLQPTGTIRLRWDGQVLNDAPIVLPEDKDNDPAMKVNLSTMIVMGPRRRLTCLLRM